MGTISQIQALVRNGLYYLTEHADDEALADGFDVYDEATMSFWEDET